MKKNSLRAFALASFALFAATAIANAQDTVRLRGTIVGMDGPMYVVKLRDGTDAKVSLAEINQGSFVGSTGMPQADGSQKAIEVHIFPESMRGTGEGHYPWDLRA